MCYVHVVLFFFLRRWRAKSTSNNQESFLIFFLFSLSHTILHLSFYLIKCNYRGKKLSKDKILLHSSCRQQTCYFEIVNKQNKKMAASCLLFSYSLFIEHSLFCCLSFSLSLSLFIHVCIHMWIIVSILSADIHTCRT